MSGHSKWNNIKHKKEKTDAQRASVFTKIGKEMAIAVRESGPDPAANSKLQALIAKAKSLNVPNDNIDRIIKKAAGNDAAQYEVVYYEGYGIGGVAVIVETTTDNRNRTAAEIRHYFDKYGGNMGTNGCVSFMFTDKGIIVIDAETVKDEDKLMEDALECGADDIEGDGESFEIYTDYLQVDKVAEALRALGYEIASAEAEKIPSTYASLTDPEQLEKFNKMIDIMEDNDDVQNVWHNLEDTE
ncbi:MAG: YebC/PmpR family DNA-binding transcriptional regulator [Clostridia bacterium]|nr:YebC/PmpR family DNA-binding transcriptional regulator [Clostridia bacterium]